MQGSKAETKLLEIDGLSVAFPVGDRWVPVVRGLSLQVGAGEWVGLVGESGSGKSMTALSVLGLVPSPGRITAGRIRFDGEDLRTLPESRLRRLRGSGLAMIFQEPMTALNPVFTVGFQIAEAIRAHRRVSARAARQETLRLLERVAIADAASRLDDYPHQLSGGQRQRVMIAMALAGNPRVLLADEPTTALDVTIQAQILELLEGLRRELSLGVLLITHDLAVVAETCDRVVVMYAGQVVEEASAEGLFGRPAHPYTRGLLAALPRLGRSVPRGRLPALPGQVPEPSCMPSGCPFHPRCEESLEVCEGEVPQLIGLAAGHACRCWLHDPSYRERVAR